MDKNTINGLYIIRDFIDQQNYGMAYEYITNWVTGLEGKKESQSFEETEKGKSFEQEMEEAKREDEKSRYWKGKDFEYYFTNKQCPICGEDAWPNQGTVKKEGAKNYGKPYRNLKCKKDSGHTTWAA